MSVTSWVLGVLDEFWLPLRRVTGAAEGRRDGSVVDCVKRALGPKVR
jgi:hypothetical protein